MPQTDALLTELCRLGFMFPLSLSFSSPKKIEFRNTDHLNEILLTYSVAPHQPGVVCAVSPSILVYVDISKNPQQFYWLDCSDIEPKLLRITTNFPGVQDMCAARLENESLLIAISYDANQLIHAYNSSTGQLKWSVRKKIPSGTFKSHGVVGDNNGRLFLTDNTNNCIQMFSASNGQYLRCLIKQGDQGLGLVCGLSWCEATLSLVVSHHNGEKWFLSAVH